MPLRAAAWLFALLLGAGPSEAPVAGASEGVRVRGGAQNSELMALALAKGHLDTGRFRMADQSFRAVLERKPGSGKAKIGLSRALLGQGRCAEALELLAEVRPFRAWNVTAALTEGGCRLRTGDAAGALAAYEEAAAMNSNKADAWFQLALNRRAAGDLQGAAEAREHLIALEDGAKLVGLMDVWVAYNEGETDLDIALAELERAAFGQPGGGRSLLLQVAVFDGLRWLDLDDPHRAGESFSQGMRARLTDPRVSGLRSEAYRRMGLLLEAHAVIERPALGGVEATPQWADLRVRMRVDEGDLPGARALLEEHPAPLARDTWATRWYLARAEGDEVAMGEAREAWEALPRPPDQALHQLIPIHAR